VKRRRSYYDRYYDYFQDEDEEETEDDAFRGIAFAVDRILQSKWWSKNIHDDESQRHLITAMRARYIYPHYLDLVGSPGPDDYRTKGKLTTACVGIWTVTGSLTLVTLLLMGCTTCHEVKLNTLSEGGWVAVLRHRVCGNYSGYSVGIYKTGGIPVISGNGEKEPFQAVYRTGIHNENNIPVTVEWVAEGRLVIHHDTRTVIDMSEQKPMVIKAEKVYQNVKIDYDPEPVIWEKPELN